MLEIPFFSAIFLYAGAFAFFTYFLPLIREIYLEEYEKEKVQEHITDYFRNLDPWCLSIINNNIIIYYT
jgi:hypothetical protein